MNTNQYLIKNQTQLDTLLADLVNKEFGDFGFLVQITVGKRTHKQQGAMEVFFRLIAEDLNAGGHTMRKMLKKEIEIEWSQPLVKKYLFKPIMKAVTGKTSTTQLDRKEVSEVAEVLSDHLAQKMGVVVNFPSHEAPMV